MLNIHENQSSPHVPSLESHCRIALNKILTKLINKRNIHTKKEKTFFCRKPLICEKLDPTSSVTWFRTFNCIQIKKGIHSSDHSDIESEKAFFNSILLVWWHNINRQHRGGGRWIRVREGKRKLFSMGSRWRTTKEMSVGRTRKTFNIMSSSHTKKS